MSLEGLDAVFRKVVPDFDLLIVASRNHVWLVVAVVVFDEVHAPFFVGVEAEVWCRHCGRSMQSFRLWYTWKRRGAQPADHKCHSRGSDIDQSAFTETALDQAVASSELEIDQTVTVRSRQAVANELVSFRLIEISIM